MPGPQTQHKGTVYDDVTYLPDHMRANGSVLLPPTHNREPYDTLLYCPTSNIMCPYRSVYAERMPRADCSSNTIRDSQ